MRAAHTFAPNTTDPHICKTHDLTCKRPSCAIATRMIPEGITKAVRIASYKQYLADKRVDFEPTRYGERPAPTLLRVVQTALSDNDPESRSYKGERSNDTDLRAAFMRAMKGAK